jgi:hypothetical protein
MSDRMALEHRCIYKDRISNNSVGKADSNFHAIIWRPVGGVTDEQIQLLYQQFRKDLGDGQPKIAERGTFSIEGTGTDKHVHIALILTQRAETTVTSTRYKALLGKPLLAKACCTADGVKIKNHALVCCQPPTNKMEHYKQTTWLAYPMKEAAKNPDFVAKDYDNGNTRRLAFVFDGLSGNALKQAQKHFEVSIRTFWKNKLVKTNYIYFNNMTKLAKEFYPIHCPELPWCPTNRAEILARMYLHKGRYLRYEFAANFFKEKYITDKFTLHADDDDFHDQVVAAIQRTFDIVDGKTKPTNSASLTIKALREELKALKKPQKHRCKNPMCRKWGWTRLSTLNDDNSEWWAMCDAKRDALQAKAELELEVADLKRQLEEQQPPAERQKRKIQTPTIVGQSKRPKVDNLHKCDKCDDCGVQERAWCAMDQGLPLYT